MTADVPLPELDLLPHTLKAHGVMQLESSRGCTFACSFCPRDHKGMWFGDDASRYGQFLDHVARVFADFPALPRRIFLVDEEFFGYRPGAEQRVLRVAEALHRAGFGFETSARVDQVFRPRKDAEWHLHRLAIWRQLVTLGLERCLFGVESGVDTVLHRFRKKTTAHQNTVAVRLLSLIGVPVRLTYITFDPLMTMRELVESYHYQGRHDLWLGPQPSLSDIELLRIAEDDAASVEYSSGQPIYQQIPYMLVSMEPLLGSDYLRQVEAAGLGLQENRLMGRRDAAYADPLIGLIAAHAQLWIDRTFALDYTLKSLLKISSTTVRDTLASLRTLLKQYAYRFLGMMLSIANEDESLEAAPGDGRAAIDAAAAAGWSSDRPTVKNSDALRQVMTQLFDALVEATLSKFDEQAHSLDDQAHHQLTNQLQRWSTERQWTLING